MYTVEFTNRVKPGISIADRSINTTSTPIALVGKNYTNYGTAIAENFLHLLENFANDTSPLNPTEGQLWYDTDSGLLKIYEGVAAGWVSTHGYSTSAVRPTTSEINDLWLNTASHQLHIKTAEGWTLIGPPSSSGGLAITELHDSITNELKEVVSISDNEAMPMIISGYEDFTPKTTLPGYAKIYKGVNLSDNYTMHGSITNALQLGNVVAINYARTDQSPTFGSDVTILRALKVASTLTMAATTTDATITSLQPITITVNSVQALQLTGTGKLIASSSIQLAGKTTTQIDALTGVAGDLIYDTTTAQFKGRYAAKWLALTPAIGSITLYAGTSPPPGYLLCNGGSITRAAYPALYTVLGNKLVLPNITDAGTTAVKANYIIYTGVTS